MFCGFSSFGLEGNLIRVEALLGFNINYIPSVIFSFCSRAGGRSDAVVRFCGLSQRGSETFGAPTKKKKKSTSKSPKFFFAAALEVLSYSPRVSVFVLFFFIFKSYIKATVAV